MFKTSINHLKLRHVFVINLYINETNCQTEYVIAVGSLLFISSDLMSRG